MKTIRHAFPQLDMHMYEYTRGPAGQNNDTITANERYIFRFPKHRRAIDEMERELRLLRALQGRLPLPIPDPVYSRLEPREVGQAFMGYAKLPGQPLYREMLESVRGEENVQRLAEQLGGFLWALHTLRVEKVFDFPLPIVAERETWARMYAEVRAKLFPLMRPDAREAVAAHFETHLDQPGAFAYTLALIHGDFGASNILYDAKTRRISGIIDWSSAGLGDPAVDIAALICPASYGEGFAARLFGVYSGVMDLLPRAQFYIGTFALQEALFGAEQGDAVALRRGLADYA